MPMRVMLLVMATKDSEPGFLSMTRVAMPASCARPMASSPPRTASRSPSMVPARTVIDGPFAAIRELVAGLRLWEVKDMDEMGDWR